MEYCRAWPCCCADVCEVLDRSLTCGVCERTRRRRKTRRHRLRHTPFCTMWGGGTAQLRCGVEKWPPILQKLSTLCENKPTFAKMSSAFSCLSLHLDRSERTTGHWAWRENDVLTRLAASPRTPNGRCARCRCVNTIFVRNEMGEGRQNAHFSLR